MRNGVERRLYIAATSQNDGKTTCTVGLFSAFRGRAESAGFIKPVGQRYVMVGNERIDEDAVLMRQVFGLKSPLKDMSPVAVDRDFTRCYLDSPETLHPVLTENIRKAFASAARDHDLAIIEGTGHAGVGSVFDLSNAQVARMLDARVVIVTVGGIGRPLDEIALNCSLFEQHGVRVIGAIANKVLPKKLAQTRQYLSRALERRGLPLLGVIPYTERLTWPTVQQVMEILHATVVSGEDTLSNVIASVVICAMTPHHAISYMCDKALLVIPGDRDDNVLAALSLQALRKDLDLAGLVLTGGLNLAPETMDLLRRTDIPVLSVEGATYDTVARINEMSAKIRATDPEKIRLATELVAEHVDVGRIWDAL